MHPLWLVTRSLGPGFRLSRLIRQAYRMNGWHASLTALLYIFFCFRLVIQQFYILKVTYHVQITQRLFIFSINAKIYKRGTDASRIYVLTKFFVVRKHDIECEYQKYRILISLNLFCCFHIKRFSVCSSVYIIFLFTNEI